MADIYTPDGALDYEAAARAVQGNARLSSSLRVEEVQRIQAAALLDIAVSLSAIVTGLAGGGVWLEDEQPADDERPPVGPEGEPTSEPERVPDDPIDVGDYVVTIDASIEPTVVVAMGESEGESYATLATGQRLYVSGLVKVDPPEQSTTDDEGFDLDDEEGEDDDPTDDDFDPKPKKGKGKKGKGA